MSLRLRVLNPCEEPWDEMEGGNTRRHCERCATPVHDLSAMHPREAEALVAREGELCIRYTHRAGELLHLTAPERAPSRLTMAAAGLAMLALSACTSHGDPTPLSITEEVPAPASTVAPNPFAIPYAQTPEEPCAPELDAPPDPEREVERPTREPRMAKTQGRRSPARLDLDETIQGFGI